MPSGFQKLRSPLISHFKLPLKIIAASGGMLLRARVLFWFAEIAVLETLVIAQAWNSPAAFRLCKLLVYLHKTLGIFWAWIQSLCLNMNCSWLVAKILPATTTCLVCQLWQITIITEHPAPKCGYMHTVALCLFLFSFFIFCWNCVCKTTTSAPGICYLNRWLFRILT